MGVLGKGDRCEQENEAGVRCCYGPGHRCKCRFKPIDLTDSMVAVLKDVSSHKVRKYTCLCGGELASARALFSRGLVFLRYINSRTYDATILQAGVRVLQELPR
jgi:hypothetical protein